MPKAHPARIQDAELDAAHTESEDEILLPNGSGENYLRTCRRWPKSLFFVLAGYILAFTLGTLAWQSSSRTSSVQETTQGRSVRGGDASRSADPRENRVWVPLQSFERVVADEGVELKEIQQIDFDGCIEACMAEPACRSFTVCGGISCFLKDKELKGTEDTVYNRWCTSVMQVPPEQGYKPLDPELLTPSSAPLLEFYMYRAQGDNTYPLANVNTGSLGGVLWYLHNEVVCHCPRRFGISRILRYRVKVKNTQPLLNTGRSFGLRTSFDTGKCTGPWDCTADVWDKYGYIVGCNDMVHDHFPFPKWPTSYPNATWYSIPGACPSKFYYDADLQCKATQPGGVCKGEPTGIGNCTFSYELAGEVDLDDIIGIEDGGDRLHKDWCGQGCKEYIFPGDDGNCTSWWRGIDDSEENQRRIGEVDAAFKKKYPESPSDVELPPPTCDFDRHTFYPPSHAGYIPETLTERHAQPYPSTAEPWKACVTDGQYETYVVKS